MTRQGTSAFMLFPTRVSTSAFALKPRHDRQMQTTLEEDDIDELDAVRPDIARCLAATDTLTTYFEAGSQWLASEGNGIYKIKFLSAMAGK